MAQGESLQHLDFHVLAVGQHLLVGFYLPRLVLVQLNLLSRLLENHLAFPQLDLLLHPDHHHLRLRLRLRLLLNRSQASIFSK